MAWVPSTNINCVLSRPESNLQSWTTVKAAEIRFSRRSQKEMVYRKFSQRFSEFILKVISMSYFIKEPNTCWDFNNLNTILYASSSLLWCINVDLPCRPRLWTSNCTPKLCHGKYHYRGVECSLLPSLYFEHQYRRYLHCK